MAQNCLVCACLVILDILFFNKQADKHAMKKIAAIILSVVYILLTVQGCAEVSQGFQRKFHDFTSWLNELDQKIQRHIRKTGAASASNKEAVTISSLHTLPEIVKNGEMVEIKFIYEIHKSSGLNTKIKYSEIGRAHV